MLKGPLFYPYFFHQKIWTNKRYKINNTKKPLTINKSPFFPFLLKAQRVENTTLEVLEEILIAIGLLKNEKTGILEEASKKLNILRVFIRLSKDIKAIDNKKYIALQEKLDEIGRMLGGWIKSTKTS